MKPADLIEALALLALLPLVAALVIAIAGFCIVLAPLLIVAAGIGAAVELLAEGFRRT